MNDLHTVTQILFPHPLCNRLTDRHDAGGIGTQTTRKPPTPGTRRQDLTKVPHYRQTQGPSYRSTPKMGQAVDVDHIRHEFGQPVAEPPASRIGPRVAQASCRLTPQGLRPVLDEPTLPDRYGITETPPASSSSCKAHGPGAPPQPRVLQSPTPGRAKPEIVRRQLVLSTTRGERESQFSLPPSPVEPSRQHHQ